MLRLWNSDSNCEQNVPCSLVLLLGAALAQKRPFFQKVCIIKSHTARVASTVLWHTGVVYGLIMLRYQNCLVRLRKTLKNKIRDLFTMLKLVFQ